MYSSYNLIMKGQPIDLTIGSAGTNEWVYLAMVCIRTCCTGACQRLVASRLSDPPLQPYNLYPWVY